jgi:hypothetical protein
MLLSHKGLSIHLPFTNVDKSLKKENVNKRMINNAISCSFDFIQLATKIISYSGRGALHRGQYYDCLEDARMKYVVI